MDNPFLAGLPVKPRCIKCNMLLDKGLCVEPDCSMFLVEPAMEAKPTETDPTEAKSNEADAEPAAKSAAKQKDETGAATSAGEAPR